MKKIFSILLVFVGCFFLGACGSTPQEKKEVTLVVKVPAIKLDCPHDKEVNSSYDFLLKVAESFRNNYKDANVKVKVLQFDPTRQTAEVDDCFDTPNAVDVLYEDFFNSETYVHSGRVVPLDDILTPSIKEDIADEFWELCTINGKVYMMPFLYRQNVLCYNKDLFKQCGLSKYVSNDDKVQTWSIAEWQEILDALRNGLPDNVYPIMMYAKNNQGDTHIMTYSRIYGSSFFDENGRFNLDTPKGIRGLTWIKELDNNGYCPPNSEKLTISDNSNLFANQQLAIYMVNIATEDSFNFSKGFVNFPSTDDDGIVTYFNTGFEVFDNGDADKLAVAKAFVKFIYESDWLDYSNGSIPCSKKVAEKYASQLLDAKKYIDNDAEGISFTGHNPNWVGVRKVFYPIIQKLIIGEYSPEQTAQMLDKECNAEIDEGRASSKFHN